jgi:hypothetical protein
MSWDGFPARKWQGQPPEFWIGGFAAVAVQNGAQMALKLGLEIGNAARWALAVALLMSLILVVRGAVRSILHQDELYRRIELEATAYAAVVVIVVSLMLGTLEDVSMIRHVPSTWAAAVLIVSRVIAAAILKRRYG